MSLRCRESGLRLLSKPFSSPEPVVSFGQIKPSGSGEVKVCLISLDLFLRDSAYENNMLLTASEKGWGWG